jgi:glycosyltransferase 2 family protein
MNTPFMSSAQEPLKATAIRRALQKRWRWLLGLLGLALAWHALKGVTWTAALDLLARLGPLAILMLLIVNLLQLPLMTSRWWLLLRTLGRPVDLLTACAYRAAANAASYLSPGPHFGGEPLSVYCLHHRQGIPLSCAATSVAVDRLLELLASIIVLTFCLIYPASAESGLFGGHQKMILIIAVPAALSTFLAALFTGKRPLSRLFSLFKKFDGYYLPWLSCSLGSLKAIIVQGEAMAESLFREHRRQFLLANFLSLVHWAGVFAEFWMMSVLLGLPLSFWQLTSVVAVARLAFFTPLPAGIGVLETALPWVSDLLGKGSAFGLSLCLIIRFRDLLFSLAGWGFAMHYLTYRRKAGIINDIQSTYREGTHV